MTFLKFILSVVAIAITLQAIKSWGKSAAGVVLGYVMTDDEEYEYIVNSKPAWHRRAICFTSCLCDMLVMFLCYYAVSWLWDM